MNSKTFCILVVFAFVLISVVGLASAKILVAGKIYASDFSDTIANASITVECDSNILDTLSLNDGTYAVVFDVNNCSEVNVTANDTNDSIIMKIVMELPEDDEQIQVNNNDDSDDSSSGSGGRSFYLCGNDVCDSGESVRTCPEDCNKSASDSNLLNFDDLNNLESLSDNSEEPGTLSRITGAVTGTFGTAGTTIIAILFVALITVATGIISFRRRSRRAMREAV